MRFEERIEVKAPAEDVWGLLWDIERLARCLPGCEAINELEPRRKYAAVVVERIGPFQARFGLELSVTKVDPERFVQLEVTGKDRKLAASMRGVMQARLERTGDEGTALDIIADVQVTGKIAGLGQVVIKRKSRDVIGRFAQAITAELDGGQA